MSDKIREGFDAWRSSEGWTRPDDPGEWKAWQAAIAQHPAPVAVPDGWKLVPFRATREQVNAVCMHPDLARTLYRNMVEAAPVAPAPAAQEPTAWISVDDRKPSEDAEVIVSGWAYNDPERGRYVTHAEFSDGLFKPVDATDEYDILHPPTHWMPLPAAPGDTAPPAEQPDGTTSARYRAELYDEVWEKARSMGYGNATEALAELERMKDADRTTNAARDVLAERRRQVAAEGWTPEHDDSHESSALAAAAGCYAMYTLAYPAGDPPPDWPWDKSWWKPGDERRNRVKAAALLLAEIERLDRALLGKEGEE